MCSFDALFIYASAFFIEVYNPQLES
jgi:hypothetical protein